MWGSLTITIGKRNIRGNSSNKPPCTERYARWCERTGSQLMATFLLNYMNYLDYLMPQPHFKKSGNALAQVGTSCLPSLCSTYLMSLTGLYPFLINSSIRQRVSSIESIMPLLFLAAVSSRVPVAKKNVNQGAY